MLYNLIITKSFTKNYIQNHFIILNNYINTRSYSPWLSSLECCPHTPRLQVLSLSLSLSLSLFFSLSNQSIRKKKRKRKENQTQPLGLITECP